MSASFRLTKISRGAVLVDVGDGEHGHRAAPRELNLTADGVPEVIFATDAAGNTRRATSESTTPKVKTVTEVV